MSRTQDILQSEARPLDLGLDRNQETDYTKATEKKTQRRKIALSKEMQVFGCVLLLQLHLPLVPLFLELWTNLTVEPRNVVLTASIYVISIGLSSRNILQLSAGIFASIIFAATYGIMLNPNSKPWGAGWIAFCAIEVAIVFHSFERYNRHVVEGEPYIVASEK